MPVAFFQTCRTRTRPGASDSVFPPIQEQTFGELKPWLRFTTDGGAGDIRAVRGKLNQGSAIWAVSITTFGGAAMTRANQEQEPPPRTKGRRSARGGGSLKPKGKDRAGLAARKGERPERDRQSPGSRRWKKAITGEVSGVVACQTKANVPRRRRTREEASLTGGFSSLYYVFCWQRETRERALASSSLGSRGLGAMVDYICGGCNLLLPPSDVGCVELLNGIKRNNVGMTME